MEIVVGTHNVGKLNELQNAFDAGKIKFVAVADFLPAEFVFPAETGTSYFANAYQKAAAYAKATGQKILADDGGLELAAFPELLGLKTQRFFKTATAREQNQEILALFTDSTITRQATLTATQVYFCDPNYFYTATARLHGEITAPMGTGGYGFDDIFYLPELGKTLAELSEEQRNYFSPRIRAAKKIITQVEVDARV